MTRKRGFTSRTNDLDSDTLLRYVAEGTGDVIGTDFFRKLVQKLAEILDVRYAFIAELNAQRDGVRVLAFWNGDHFTGDVEYALAGTPCEKVLAGRKQLYADGIQRLFPADGMLVDMDAEGYLATPLVNTAGEVMGHLAVVDVKPMHWQDNLLSVFDIFAMRACAEMERMRVENALRRSEEWLNAILSNMMDTVVVLDSGRHVRLFNDSAARVFRCGKGDMQNRPADDLLTEPLRREIDRFIRLASDGSGSRQIFLPEGVQARRRDGEAFAIEATLSVLRVAEESFYVFVLRDVEERRRSEFLIDQLQQKTDDLKEAMKSAYGPEDFVVGTVMMENLMSTVRQVAATDSTILLLGETGTGKELIAHTIHGLSRRRNNIMVKVNCAALPSELVESELFGHEKGAFTGAVARRKGKFELADGGTLFLDEVGELSSAGQAKLLRVLQEHEFERVGGSRTIPVDVRVITATNRDLGELVTAGKFREDLFYRLNVFPVTVPPLRERLDELPKLTNHFLRCMERKLGKRFTGISPDSLRKMYRYSWPGNVRELQNMIERAAILATTPILELDIGKPGAPDEPVKPPKPDTPPATLEQVERDHIQLALELVNWVVEGEAGAAALLGMNPSTLRYRMQKLGIRRPGRTGVPRVHAGKNFFAPAGPLDEI